ncbi:MAG TPA: addiction module protein [Steroidobacteraceae bacterium]|nr:addiction module protein [Steroidobacteraceae bacterium]
MANRTMERILSEAHELPEAERGELAQGLVRSLDGPFDASASSVWDDEILRRTKALEAGTIPHGRAPVLAVILDHANSLALGADAKPQ